MSADAVALTLPLSRAAVAVLWHIACKAMPCGTTATKRRPVIGPGLALAGLEPATRSLLGQPLYQLSYSATVKAYIIFRGFVRIVSADAGDDAAISFVLISFCSHCRRLQLLGMQRHFCRVRKNRITRHGHVYGLPCEYPDEAAKETAYKSIYRYSVQSLTPFLLCNKRAGGIRTRALVS